MAILFVTLFVVVITALLIAWVVFTITIAIIRLFARAVAAPFRMAKRADAAVMNRLQRALPTRLHRGDDIQCTNHTCRARLPLEAKFCARCGGALPTQRPAAEAVVARAKAAPLSQVA